MRTVLLVLGIFWIVGVIEVAAQPLEEKADREHATSQEASEGIVLGQFEGDVTEFAAAGAIRADGPAPDKDTLFEIGSITKVFTGILLAETVRKGKADFDDPVAKYLPDDVAGDDNPLHSITLESLAIHASGLPRLPANLDKGGDPKNPYAHYDERRLHAYLKKLTTDDLEKPGEYSYSNLGFGLLGHVLERIWEKPYPELLAERVLQPLGMTSSFVPTDYDELPAGMEERLATGHVAGEAVPHWELGSFLGAGAIVSSADDLLVFARAHWDDNTPEGLAASLKEAARPRNPGQGLGWGMAGSELSHNGGTGGFRSSLTVDPAEKTARVRLVNSAGEGFDREAEGEFSEIAGFWEGTLKVGKIDLRLVKYITDDGRVLQFSIDQGCARSQAVKTSFDDGAFRFSFPSIGGSYEGKLEGDRLVGTWRQTGELPLVMKRASEMPQSLKKGLAGKAEGELDKLAGFWSGYLGGKKGLFVYVSVDDVGELTVADLYSPDQTPAPIAISRIALKKTKLTFAVPAVGGSFEGKWNDAAKKISGTWTQGKGMPLELVWSAERPERG